MTAPFIAPTKRDAGPLRAPAVHLDAPIGPNDPSIFLHVEEVKA